MADSAAQKKPGFIDRVKRFFRDIKGEVKKIVWPSKKQVINNTVIVVIMVVISAIVKAKPAAAKGQYVKSCVVASTMGPGIKINPGRFV